MHARDLRRFTQIIDVLVKHELGALATAMHLRRGLVFGIQKPSPAQLRAIFEELGGGFVKLGQLLSLRPDLLPEAYCEELRKLQDRVPPFPAEQAQTIVDTAFPTRHLRLQQLIASASIADVYMATLNGHSVAVKVRRPHIADIVAEDLVLLERLARLIAQYLKPRVFDPLEICREFARSSRQELNLLQEAQAIERFTKNFAHTDVRIPHVNWPFCAEHILTIEYLPGKKLSQAALTKAARSAVAQRYFAAMLKQIFEDGLFHADPHPGNVLVMPENKIAFIDFGIVGELDEDLRATFSRVFAAAIAGDFDGFVAAFLRLDLVHGPVDRQQLRSDLKDLLAKYYHANLRALNISELFFGSLDVARTHHLKMPRNFVLLGKALLTTESVCLRLDPEFNLLRESQAFLAHSALSPRLKSLPKRALRSIHSVHRFISDVPDQIALGMAQLARGEEELGRINEDLSRLKTEVDKTGDRIVLGMLVSALLIAASVLADFQDPTLAGYPAFSVIGLVLATCLAIMLGAHVVRERVGALLRI